MNDTPLRIIELQAENVKRLKAVRIKPDKTLVRIEGRNAQGKTSVLDAIAAALGGGKWQPEKPVRQGEKKASVKLNLGELEIERRWTAKGGTTLVVTSNGTQLATPQTILDRLMGDLTFDPLAFVRMKPADQSDLLRRLAGLDFTALDAERAEVFAERTGVNRDAKAAALRASDMPPKPANDTPINVRELADKQQQAVGHNRQVEAANDAHARSLAAIEDAKVAVKIAQQKLADAEKVAADCEKRCAGLELIDVGDLGEQIGKAEAHNRAIDVRRGWEEREAEAKALQEQADKLTARLEEIDGEKSRALAAAQFPLDGLGIDDNGPTLHGIPFSQASSAEQLRTGVAIGLAGKPRARIILIRDGSLLDGAGLQSLQGIAEEFDAQVFVERVAESAAPSAVYIEDGEVVESITGKDKR